MTQHLHELMERRLPKPFEVMMLVLVTFTATSFSKSPPTYIIYSFENLCYRAATVTLQGKPSAGRVVPLRT